ncbi:MAG TPA: GTPase HflX [Thermoplasmata archaeon]|jgi:GTP-binding protein HflX|nr:GTPase HflX [Thermoplasmata archaeon]
MDVLLVGLNTNLVEIRTFIESAGYRLVGEFLQHRPRPDPRTFLGKGKLEELKKVVKEKSVDAVVFAGSLKPSQHHELEKALGVQCFDRLRVILDIFTQRAHTREAKLQVELAMLQYEVPILKEWIHSAAAGERPGFMAGGEYRVDAYYETVKRRMTKVRRELETVRKERALRRDHRHERGFYHVSLAGYANAGKSSLFNALSGETVQVEDRLFTTLSTTTRMLKEVRRRILVTDTVGLVADVPLWLVEAFQSTFEEVFASDLVLLLIDVSDPPEEIDGKVRLAEATLLPGIDADRIIPVLTKTDRDSGDGIERARQRLKGSPFSRAPISVSANTGDGLEILRNEIAQEFRYPVELTLRLPQADGKATFLNWLHDRTDVLSVSYPQNEVEVHVRCRDQDVARIRSTARIVSGPSSST